MSHPTFRIDFIRVQYGLFCNSISSLHYMALNSRMNWKGLEPGLGLTELLLQHLLVGLRKTTEPVKSDGVVIET